MTKKELLAMKLHEIRKVPCVSHDIDVMRVFGGWIYNAIGWDVEKDSLKTTSMCFVPEEINVYTKPA